MKPKFFTVVLIIGALLALGFWYYLLFGPTGNSKLPANPVGINPTNGWFYPYQSALDGTGVERESDISPRVVAIMVDNHPEANPQIGLSKARIIYEAPVEGNFTRYMAIFASTDDVDMVGPVRSARPYFIDWAGEYGAVYMHSGGSPDALAILATSTAVNDFNEFWNGQFYWRDKSRTAPHNLFTKSSLWQTLMNSQESLVEPNYKSWNFVTSTKALESRGEDASIVSILMGKNYEVTWAYNTSTKMYERAENKLPIYDAGNVPVTARTIIVQKTSVKTIDDVGRKAVATVGSGQAEFYSLGRVLKGTWQKTKNNRTQFYDSLGQDFQFAPGSIWIEVPF